MRKALELQSTYLECAKLPCFGSRGSPVQIRPARPLTHQHRKSFEHLLYSQYGSKITATNRSYAGESGTILPDSTRALFCFSSTRGAR